MALLISAPIHLLPLLLLLLLLCFPPVPAQSPSDLTPSTVLPPSLLPLLASNGSASGGRWTALPPSGSPTRTPDLSTSTLTWNTSTSPSSSSPPSYPVTFAPLLSPPNSTLDAYLASLSLAWQLRVIQTCDFDPQTLLTSSIPPPPTLTQVTTGGVGASGYVQAWAAAGYADFGARTRQLAAEPRCALTFLQYAATKLRARADATWYSDVAYPTLPAARPLALHLLAEASPSFVCTSVPAQAACNGTTYTAGAYPARALSPTGAVLLSGLPQRPAASQCPATAHSAVAQVVSEARLVVTLSAYAIPAATRALQCGPRGWWSYADSGCRCYAGWSGANCTAQLPCLTDSVRGVVCSGAGHCNGTSTSTPCTCSTGTSGALCNVVALLPTLQVQEQAATVTAVLGVCTPAAYQQMTWDVQTACPIPVTSPLTASQLSAFNASAWSVLSVGNFTGAANGCALRDCLRRLQTLLNCVDARYHAEGGQWAVVSQQLYGLQQLLPPLIPAVRSLHCNASIAVSQTATQPPTGLSANCSGLGLWDAVHLTCRCPYPSMGPTCATVDPQLCVAQCSGRGACVLSTAAGSSPAASCACTQPWGGPDCTVNLASPVGIRSILSSAIMALNASNPKSQYSASSLACSSAPTTSTTWTALLQAQCSIGPGELLARGLASMTRSCAQAVVAFLTCEMAVQSYLPTAYSSSLAAGSACSVQPTAVSNRTAAHPIGPWPAPTLLPLLQVAYATLLPYRNVSNTVSVSYLRPPPPVVSAVSPCEALATQVYEVCAVVVVGRFAPVEAGACAIPGCAAALLTYARCYVNRTHQQPNTTTVPLNVALLNWLSSPNCTWTNVTAKRLLPSNTSTYVFPSPPPIAYSSCAVNVTSQRINSTAALARLGMSRLLLQSTLLTQVSPANLAAAGAAMTSTCGFDYNAPPVSGQNISSVAQCLTLSPACALSAVAYYLQLVNSYGLGNASTCAPTSPYPLIAIPQVTLLQCAVIQLLSQLCPVPFILAEPVGAVLTPVNCVSCNATSFDVSLQCGLNVTSPVTQAMVNALASSYPSIACAKALVAYANCSRAAVPCSAIPVGTCPSPAYLLPLLTATWNFLYFRTHSSSAPPTAPIVVHSSSTSALRSSSLSSSVSPSSSLSSFPVSSAATSPPATMSAPAPTSTPSTTSAPSLTSAPVVTSAPATTSVASLTSTRSLTSASPATSAPSPTSPLILTSPPSLLPTSTPAASIPPSSTSSQQPLPPPPPPASSSSSSTTPVGAIVGGVVGGVLGCVLLICLTLFLLAAARKREKKQRETSGGGGGGSASSDASMSAAGGVGGMGGGGLGAAVLEMQPVEPVEVVEVHEAPSAPMSLPVPTIPDRPPPRLPPRPLAVDAGVYQY